MELRIQGASHRTESRRGGNGTEPHHRVIGDYFEHLRANKFNNLIKWTNSLKDTITEAYSEETDHLNIPTKEIEIVVKNLTTKKHTKN